jgi:hypothetical protein
MKPVIREIKEAEAANESMNKSTIEAQLTERKSEPL